MTQAYTRPGSTDVDYNAVSGDSVTSAAQKLDNAIDDIYTQIQDGSTLVKGVLQIGTGATQAAAGNKGVTNGDSHDHSGGDGAQIAYASLSGAPTVSVFGASLVDDSDASAARTTLGVAIGTDVQAYDADICISDVVKSYTRQHYASPVAVTSSSGALAIDCDIHALATITLSENTTVSAASNQASGKVVELIVTGASTYTLSWNTNWKMADGTTVSTTPVAAKVTRIIAESDGTYMRIYRVIQEA